MGGKRRFESSRPSNTPLSAWTVPQGDRETTPEKKTQAQQEGKETRKKKDKEKDKEEKKKQPEGVIGDANQITKHKTRNRSGV